MTVLQSLIISRSPSPVTSRAELLTHVKILTQNANEDWSISHAIWPILELVQKQMIESPNVTLRRVSGLRGLAQFPHSTAL